MSMTVKPSINKLLELRDIPPLISQFLVGNKEGKEALSSATGVCKLWQKIFEPFASGRTLSNGFECRISCTPLIIPTICLIAAASEWMADADEPENPRGRRVSG